MIEAFINLHPFLQWCSLWVLWPIGAAIYVAVVRPTVIFTSWRRSKNILAHGWPPSHIDADGKFKKPDEA